ncbi:MAG: dihydroorotase, partial [Candidatus Cloacimonetes bacterium]|nr:dihydroorotase [Candidatus Cloacimonadota bacterium]
LPGMIDPHVHMRDMQQAFKEDWQSGSKAALRGGVTTVFDMPNTLPASNSRTNLELKRQRASKSEIKAKFYLGAENNNLEELKCMLSQKPQDICGIKVFLAASSANEVVRDRETLGQIFKIAADYNAIIAVHTELQDCLEKFAGKFPPEVNYHNQIRNRQCAIAGTKMVLDLTNQIKNKLYITHVSTAEEVELIRAYKAGNEIYAEATPHHLLLDESIIPRVGNIGKVNPPLRTKYDREALWRGIRDGTIDTIGSDHAPHQLAEKQENYQGAPAGFPGLETSLPLMLDAVQRGYMNFDLLADLIAGNTARIFALDNYGSIRVGKKADLVVVNVNGTTVVQPDHFCSKAKYSPFAGMILRGSVEMTIVDGEIKYRRN